MRRPARLGSSTAILIGTLLATAAAAPDAAGRPHDAVPVPSATIDLGSALGADGSFRGDATLAGSVDTDSWRLVSDLSAGEAPRFAPAGAGVASEIGPWSALGSNGGNGALNGQVTAFAVSGTDLYVGGQFTNAAGIPEADYIARWNGSAWSALGSVALNGFVYSLAVSGGDLYVGGQFGDAGGDTTADNIAKWNGGAWSGLGGPAGGFSGSINSSVFALAVSGGDLYAGGAFLNAGGIAEADRVARWNGSSWSALGSNGADGALPAIVDALAVSGSDVYVGGTFSNAAGIAEADHLARWNGSSWSALGSGGAGVGAITGNVYALAVTGGDLYVGGTFLDAAGIPQADGVARWNGGSWSALGTGSGAGGSAINGGYVNALAVVGGDLYVGGYIRDVADIVAADYVARWDGSSWAALGSDGAGKGALSWLVNAFAASGSHLYVGGGFTDVAGIVTADFAAAWGLPTAPSAPLDVIAVPGNAAALVSWEAPSSDGGAAVTGYTVTSSPGALQCTTSGAPYCIVGGLTNGQGYTFTVTATNAHGTGPASAPSAPVTPGGVPGAPTGVAVVPSGSSGDVTWSAPADDGGSPITGYTATASPGGKTCTTDGPLLCTITGLADGLYVVTVVATNATGPSLASGPSAVFRIDVTAPVVTAPVASLVAGSTLGTSTVPVDLAWSASDAGSGLDHVELALSTNGGAYAPVALGSPTAVALTRSFSPSPTATYRFRVRAVDQSGNTSGWATGPRFHVRLTAESAGSVNYAGTWAKASSASAYGGKVRYTTHKGASASFTFSGRAIAWVAHRGSAMGKAKVYVDGVLRATVDLHATATAWRRVAFVRSWSSSGNHTIRIVCAGTAGHPRIDLDAFVVLG